MNSPELRRKLTPGRFIAKLRASDPVFMVDLFECGGCYHLYQILRLIWPSAEAWVCPLEGHVYTLIDGEFYDINGRAARLSDSAARPMTGADEREAQGFLRSRWRAVGKGNRCRS